MSGVFEFWQFACVDEKTLICMCARLVEPYILMFVKIKNNNNVLLYSWFCTIKYVFNSVTKNFEGKFTFKKDLSLTQWSQLVDCIRDCREATFGQRPRVNEPQIGRSSLEPKYNLKSRHQTIYGFYHFSLSLALFLRTPTCSSVSYRLPKEIRYNAKD